MVRHATPRERMVAHAAIAIRERGVEATSFNQVLIAAGAPRGSLYYYFPRGKAQLVEEATAHAGRYVARQFEECFERRKPGAALARFAALYCDLLRTSDYEAGCPVVPAALEGARAPGARDAAAEAFDQWIDIVSTALVRHGLTRSRARSVATMAVSALEGGIVLSRAGRTTQPLERVGRELKAMIDGLTR